jgi:serine/threonine-protein kinase
VRIGPYEVVSTLGQGGMGVVYAARSPEGRSVAIKVLRKSEGDVLARFEREQRLLASFGEAEGFVSLLDAGTTPMGPYLVMPLVPGGTLRKKLEAGPLGIEETIALGRALAAALGTAHSRGVVHRDMKPENILFTAAGRPLVTDLGLAKHFDGGAPGASQSVSLSEHGALRGTAGYMAPEQMADARSVGPCADVFSLGAILYECLAGEPPFLGRTVLELLTRVGNGKFEPLRARRPDVPEWLAAVVERALAPAAWDRFPDGLALGQALAGADPGAPKRRAVQILVGAGLLGLLAVVGLVVMVLASKGAPPPRAIPAVPPPVPAAPPVGSGPRLPPGLRLAGRKVPATDGKEVDLYVWRLPDDSEMELVAVPPGDFIMGAEDADAYPAERPKHTHSMDHGYWIGRNDVTWRQYRAFSKAAGQAEPATPRFGAKDDHPVVGVSRDEALAYCVWAGLVLPSEAEWEKAARGEDQRKYPWGNEEPTANRCAFGQNYETGAGTSAVGRCPNGASPYGALDMAGNVWQWCEDWYDDESYARYASGHTSPPPGGSDRVLRGGSWGDPARFCRSSYRSGLAPSIRSGFLGFRVVLRSVP